MGKLTLRIKLEDEVDFESESEQKALGEAIDTETFTAPAFVGAPKKRFGDVVVKLNVSNLESSTADEIGAIVADHFDSDVETVRIE